MEVSVALGEGGAAALGEVGTSALGEGGTVALKLSAFSDIKPWMAKLLTAAVSSSTTSSEQPDCWKLLLIIGRQLLTS